MFKEANLPQMGGPKWEQLGDLLEITLPILKCMELQYHGDANVSITAANTLECRTLTTICNAYV